SPARLPTDVGVWLRCGDGQRLRRGTALRRFMQDSGGEATKLGERRRVNRQHPTDNRRLAQIAEEHAVIRGGTTDLELGQAHRLAAKAVRTVFQTDEHFFADVIRDLA